MHSSILLAQISLSTASLLSGFPSDVSSSVLNSRYSTSQQINSTCSVWQDGGSQGLLRASNDLESCHDQQGEPPSPIVSNEYSPWIEEVITCTTNASTEYCTYHTPEFANNRGLSVVTKPEIASKIATFQSVVTPATETPERAFPPPFEIKELPGRGLGVIANRTIERGERLFAHAVMGIFHNDMFYNHKTPHYREYESLFHDAVDHLPNDSNKIFWELASHEEENGVDGVIGRLNTNVFAITIGGEDHSAIVPETARMNHDCRPNAMYYLDPETLVHYTHASRTIHPGEEITITYIDPLQTYKERQAAISNSWGFKCTCNLCTLPQAFRTESDMRIKLILQLNKEFEDITTSNKAIQDIVPKAELLVSLYEQEKLYGAMEDPYRIAALSFAKVGKVWEAIKWTMKATEAFLIAEGSREKIVEEMKGNGALPDFNEE